MQTRSYQAQPRPVRAMVRAIAGVSVLLASGCSVTQLTRQALLHTVPNVEKIPPEYNRLPGTTTLVHVWVPPEILWDYPKVRLDLAAKVSAYLEANVENVTVVNPLRVESHLERESNFEVDPAEVGRQFDADAVVHLSVYHFSMRDPGYAQFYRGRIGASVVVYDLAGGTEAAERIPLHEVEVTVPEEGPLGFYNVRPEQVREMTYDVFAVEVGRKFHEYEKELD